MADCLEARLPFVGGTMAIAHNAGMLKIIIWNYRKSGCKFFNLSGLRKLFDETVF
jgi:hypothetical protein